MQPNDFKFDLGEQVNTAAGPTVVLGRTKFRIGESYLIEICGQQAWVPVAELSPISPQITN